jgi:hypothetical protein
LFPKILLPGKSDTMMTKFIGYEKVFAINADSLDEYCKKTDGLSIFRKKWAKIYRRDSLDKSNKICTFIIN